jgi:hypothetical protein
MSRFNYGHVLTLVACLAIGAALGLMVAPAMRDEEPAGAANHVVVSDPAAAGESGELEHLRKQVAALRREQAALEKRLDDGTATARPDEPDTRAHEAPEDPEDPGEGLTEQEQLDVFREQQQADFAQQAVDPAWRASREALIRSSLTSPRWTGLGYKLTHAECRTNMCKIELTAPPNARVSFGNMLFGPPFEGQVSFFFADDDTIVAYAARPEETTAQSP